MLYISLIIVLGCLGYGVFKILHSHSSLDLACGLFLIGGGLHALSLALEFMV